VSRPVLHERRRLEPRERAKQAGTPTWARATADDGRHDPCQLDSQSVRRAHDVLVAADRHGLRRSDKRNGPRRPRAAFVASSTSRLVLVTIAGPRCSRSHGMTKRVVLPARVGATTTTCASSSVRTGRPSKRPKVNPDGSRRGRRRSRGRAHGRGGAPLQSYGRRPSHSCATSGSMRRTGTSTAARTVNAKPQAEPHHSAADGMRATWLLLGAQVHGGGLRAPRRPAVAETRGEPDVRRRRDP
jgi:hypothetical protein